MQCGHEVFHFAGKIGITSLRSEKINSDVNYKYCSPFVTAFEENAIVHSNKSDHLCCVQWFIRSSKAIQ